MAFVVLLESSTFVVRHMDTDIIYIFEVETRVFMLNDLQVCLFDCNLECFCADLSLLGCFCLSCGSGWYVDVIHGSRDNKVHCPLLETSRS